MFVPLNLIQDHKPLKTVRDCIEVLEQWVMREYPNSTTANIAYTKAQCYGVLHSFHQMGKLHYVLTLEDIEMAVVKFMEEALWVDPVDSLNALVNLQQHPRSWYMEVTLKNVLVAIFTFNKNVVKDFVLGNYRLVQIFGLFLTKPFIRGFGKERLSDLDMSKKVKKKISERNC